MSLTTDPRPPLPDWVLDAYEVLTNAITHGERGTHQRQVPSIPRDNAIEVLRTTDDVSLSLEDADHAVTRLLERGYLYEVDGELRVTTPSDD
ncbi:hypothetical protein [Halopiger aswanensis]|uniref:Uncharacterized protein n=1 Tax=Halopiger aswanensis TaxID=148449 RepID=A0A3R7KIQ7_9EURY|nr:hypothetical protein [Halopiger aswanensis]RKD88669.1 hypothetical protein ATJ93_4336 [Halopiger aswanensis]